MNTYDCLSGALRIYGNWSDKMSLRSLLRQEQSEWVKAHDKREFKEWSSEHLCRTIEAIVRRNMTDDRRAAAAEERTQNKDINWRIQIVIICNNMWWRAVSESPMTNSNLFSMLFFFLSFAFGRVTWDKRNACTRALVEHGWISTSSFNFGHSSFHNVHRGARCHRLSTDYIHVSA